MSFPVLSGYVVTERLGAGSYSTVYKAYPKVGRRVCVAVKCLSKARARVSGAAADRLVAEIRTLKALRHRHVVRMRDFTWDRSHVFILMEYCSGGDLARLIRRHGRLHEAQTLYFLQQLAAALQYLREMGVVHMDLKPHNLLLHKEGEHTGYILKVADFGFAAQLCAAPEAGAEAGAEASGSSSTGGSLYGVRGSPLYMAPEVLLADTPYDHRADLWSVGVIVFECLVGHAPYRSATLSDLLRKVHAHTHIQFPPGVVVSAGCQELVSRLLQHEPRLRITHEEFFAHPFLDLEHRPGKDTYDRGVCLVQRAVSLEGAGRGEAAFRAYRAALRCLVPCAAAEAHAQRKAQLTDRINTYMCRAEELQRRLYGHTATSGPGPPGEQQAPGDTGAPGGQRTPGDTGVAGGQRAPAAGLASCCTAPGTHTAPSDDIASYDYSPARAAPAPDPSPTRGPGPAPEAPAPAAASLCVLA